MIACQKCTKTITASQEVEEALLHMQWLTECSEGGNHHIVQKEVNHEKQFK